MGEGRRGTLFRWRLVSIVFIAIYFRAADKQLEKAAARIRLFVREPIRLFGDAL